MADGRKRRKGRKLGRGEMPPLCAKMGKAMQRERKRRKWSQEDLAERTGLTQGEVSSLENGRCLPTMETGERVARGFRWRFSRWIARLERMR